MNALLSELQHDENSNDFIPSALFGLNKTKEQLKSKGWIVINEYAFFFHPGHVSFKVDESLKNNSDQDVSFDFRQKSDGKYEGKSLGIATIRFERSADKTIQFRVISLKRALGYVEEFFSLRFKNYEYFSNTHPIQRELERALQKELKNTR